MGSAALLALGMGLVVTVACVDKVASAMGKMSRHRPSQGKRLDWYCFFSPVQLTGGSEKHGVKERGDRLDERVQDWHRPFAEKERPLLRV